MIWTCSYQSYRPGGANQCNNTIHECFFWPSLRRLTLARELKILVGLELGGIPSWVRESEVLGQQEVLVTADKGNPKQSPL